MKKEGTSAILSHCLDYKEGKVLPYREESLNVLLFEGSLTGVASDLHLDPSFLVSSPMGGGCPKCWAGAWPSLGHDHKGQGVCSSGSLLDSPLSLLLASVPGMLGSGSCLCAVITP